jgi:hypothetical protein
MHVAAAWRGRRAVMPIRKEINTMKRAFLCCLLLWSMDTLGSDLPRVEAREYTGAAAPPGHVRWDMSDNWEPRRVPTLTTLTLIGFAQPYAAIAGAQCEAGWLVVQTGGTLVVRAADDGAALTVTSDLIVERGGTFATAGGNGDNGPVIAVGGNIVNHGTFNISGVGNATPGLVLKGCILQTFKGSADIVLQNLTADHKFIVDGITVYVTGQFFAPPGLWPCEINGGRLIVGEYPLPVTLAGFRAEVDNNGSCVRVAWGTLSEVNNYGFHLERRGSGEETFVPLAFIPGQGNSVAPHEYSYEDRAVPPGDWLYRLCQTDLDGTTHLSEEIRVTVQTIAGVRVGTCPPAFALYQNYPNPFNPTTSIRFSVEGTGESVVSVFDGAGRRVQTLFEGTAESGRVYEVTFTAAGLASGTYFCRLQNGGRTEIRRMMLVR